MAQADQKVFRNTAFVRHTGVTNIVACIADVSPGENWVLADALLLTGLTKLWRQAGVTYYGYL